TQRCGETTTAATGLGPCAWMPSPQCPTLSTSRLSTRTHRIRSGTSSAMDRYSRARRCRGLDPVRRISSSMREREISPLSTLVTGAAGAIGAVLGTTFAVTARIRRSKPLHPVGVVARGVLTVAPGTERSGSPLLDEPGEHACLVRASYAMGTGPRLPDIEGFALRVMPKDPAAGFT